MNEYLNIYKDFWKRYFDFSGVTNRKDFWITVLINAVIIPILVFIISLILAFIPPLEAIWGGFVSIYSLVIFIPTVAITFRRFHDVNKSGALVIISKLIDVIFTVLLIILIIDIFGFFLSGLFLEGNPISIPLIISLIILGLISLVFKFILFIFLISDTNPNSRYRKNNYQQMNYNQPVNNQMNYNQPNTENQNPYNYN